jgi:hypothetical protein
MHNKIFLFLVVAFVASGTFVMARMFRPDQVPNGTVNSCLTCHVFPGGPRNPFGQTVEGAFLSTPGAAGNVQWGVELASIDSDGDGFTNGQELQDPSGSWAIGQPAPGDPSLVTGPGDPNDFPTSTGVEPLHGSVGTFKLAENYPNPFNPSTTIGFNVPRNVRIRLDIFSLTGERVRTLADEDVQAGGYAVRWNGRDDAGRQVESGTYMYRLSAGDFVATRRMVLLK